MLQAQQGRSIGQQTGGKGAGLRKMFDTVARMEYTDTVIEQRVFLRRDAPGASAFEGTRMRIPDYPSNREADERTVCHCRKVGRRPGRMRQSRET